MSKNNKLPEPGKIVLALLKFEDVAPMPVIGFMAETIDTHEPYFHCPGNWCGYHPDIVVKWRYLKDVAPDFIIG
jgi:hypothetical protein